MGLGGEVEDRVRGMFPRAVEQRCHQLRVTDVPVDEAIPAFPLRAVLRLHVGQALEIPRVRQQVEIDDVDLRVALEQVTDQVRANEPRAAGDQDRARRELVVLRHAYTGRSRTLASGGSAASLGERSGLAPGQSMPSAGSDQMMPRSSSGT